MSRKSSDRENVDIWLEWGINLTTRKIFLDDDVDSDTISTIIKGVHLLEQKDSTAPITVIISTYGGTCYDGLALYDALRASSCEIHTVGLGKVMSMGTILMLAGDEKYSYPNTTYMWHSVATEGVSGKLFDAKNDTKETERLWDSLITIYSQRSKEKNKSWWKKWLQYEDRFGGVAKAKELGFVNEIIGEIYE